MKRSHGKAPRSRLLVKNARSVASFASRASRQAFESGTTSTPTIPKNDLEKLTAKAKALGFATGELIIVDQARHIKVSVVSV